MIFGMSLGSVERYLQEGLIALEKVLLTLPQADIAWPEEEHVFRSYADKIKNKQAALSDCVGFIDGLLLPVGMLFLFLKV